ncbi:hypothetical protein LVD15_06090 [Fulvivirga maritima]|uniref:hypothetical protein n=1 Tax=Fulvivirga maritima TaxID=2904247 RepID=UPI001F354003|nr:hypothetical protein [Fulvivirga maritima]UII27991.1 hypothetical protein LVD15_06090 [Fulvivirga maritima]
MKLNIPEKYADLYLKALSERKRMLQAKIAEFQREIDDIENHMSALTSIPIFQDNLPTSKSKYQANSYQEEWPWSRKITYYQELNKQIMTSAEVVDFILNKEPSLDKNKVRSSISAALSNKHRSGDYIKFVDPVTNTAYYGPPEWFINKEQPHLTYVPNDLKKRLIGK